MAVFSYASWNNAGDHYTQINNTLASHGGWTLVEEVAVAPNAVTVWRSPTLPDTPQFHIGVYRSTATNTNTQAKMLLFEDWNSATKSFARPAPSNVSGDAATPAADASYGGGTWYPLYSSGSTINPILFQLGSPTANASATVCVGVTNAGVAVGYASSSSVYSGHQYAGRMDSLVTVADPAPLTVGYRGTYNNKFWAFTRYPGVTATQAGNWSGYGDTWTKPTGTLGGGLDRLFNARAVGTRYRLGHSYLTAQAATHGGALRGLIPGLLEFQAAKDTVAPGDTMVIGADTWECVGYNDSYGVAWFINRNA